MNPRKSKPRAGLSLLEVLVAASMLNLLLFAFYAVVETLSRSQLTSDARLDARQHLRSGVRAFGLMATQSSLFYFGGGAPMDLGGFPCQLPQLRDGEVLPGNSLALAVPVDVTRPLDILLDPLNPRTALIDPNSTQARPDGFPDNRYTIAVLTSAPLDPPDSRNPGARDLVLLRWDSVEPRAHLAPQSINLGSLGAPSVVRRFRAYLLPEAEGGFQATYLTRSQLAASALMDVSFRRVPLSGPPQSERGRFVFHSRNQF